MVITDMAQPTHSPNRPADALMRHAVERAKVLSTSRPQGESSARWSHEVAHVGDLSVLLLALLD